jgi:PBP1b-binding outer membrane lipoprotein LpoB
MPSPGYLSNDAGEVPVVVTVQSSFWKGVEMKKLLALLVCCVLFVGCSESKTAKTVKTGKTDAVKTEVKTDAVKTDAVKTAEPVKTEEPAPAVKKTEDK